MLKIKNRFGSHAEQEIEDAQIRQEAQFVLEDLPVLARLEVTVFLWMFGVYHLTIIGMLRPLPVVG